MQTFILISVSLSKCKYFRWGNIQKKNSIPLNINVNDDDNNSDNSKNNNHGDNDIDRDRINYKKMINIQS